mmetsp:Transcript_8903/g.29675  ORF Transcript_8903/g.29675 Transcript_8903/m.29675 type:complete len:492 (-) Transcript_8903:273-1748(-)
MPTTVLTLDGARSASPNTFRKSARAASLARNGPYGTGVGTGSCLYPRLFSDTPFSFASSSNSSFKSKSSTGYFASRCLCFTASSFFCKSANRAASRCAALPFFSASFTRSRSAFSAFLTASRCSFPSCFSRSRCCSLSTVATASKSFLPSIFCNVASSAATARTFSSLNPGRSASLDFWRNVSSSKEPRSCTEASSFWAFATPEWAFSTSSIFLQTSAKAFVAPAVSFSASALSSFLRFATYASLSRSALSLCFSTAFFQLISACLSPVSPGYISKCAGISSVGHFGSRNSSPTLFALAAAALQTAAAAALAFPVPFPEAPPFASDKRSCGEIPSPTAFSSACSLAATAFTTFCKSPASAFMAFFKRSSCPRRSCSAILRALWSDSRVVAIEEGAVAVGSARASSFCGGNASCFSVWVTGSLHTAAAVAVVSSRTSATPLANAPSPSSSCFAFFAEGASEASCALEGDSSRFAAAGAPCSTAMGIGPSRWS